VTTATAQPPRLLLLARDIKLSHSVFALPFAVLAGYLAAAARGIVLHQQWVLLTLLVVCMVFARTVAMTVNRLADFQLDAKNPRTAGRAIPSGQLTPGYVLAATVVCAICFVVTASGFWFMDGNMWPVILSPFVLLWLCLYSFTKRFTWLCHLFLGSALALSPIAASIAVHPAYLVHPAPWLLAVMVMCWVAGFDVIYALQDVQVDRDQGLYSMPSRLGVERALWISRVLHVVAIGALFTMWRTSPALGEAFLIGAVIAAGLLILEQGIIWRSATNHIHIAFLTVNGVFSVLLGVLGVVDILRLG